MNQAVTLTDPVLDKAANTLTYTTALVPTAGDDDSFAGITCDGEAHLFIDDSTAAVSACTQNYNCFIGGFCSQLAVLGYLSAEDGNLYGGDTPETAPALDAGCNESPGISRWLNGADLHYWDIPHQQGGEDPAVYLCADQSEDWS